MTAVMWLWVCILMREEIGKLPGKWATCLEAISKLYPHYMCIKLYPQNILHPYRCHYTTILLYHHQNHHWIPIFAAQKNENIFGWYIFQAEIQGFFPWFPLFFQWFPSTVLKKRVSSSPATLSAAVLLKNRVVPHVHPIAQRRIRLGGATSGSMAWDI